MRGTKRPVLTPEVCADRAFVMPGSTLDRTEECRQTQGASCLLYCFNKFYQHAVTESGTQEIDDDTTCTRYGMLLQHL